MSSANRSPKSSSLSIRRSISESASNPASGGLVGGGIVGGGLVGGGLVGGGIVGGGLVDGGVVDGGLVGGGGNVNVGLGKRGKVGHEDDWAPLESGRATRVTASAASAKPRDGGHDAFPHLLDGGRLLPGGVRCWVTYVSRRLAPLSVAMS